MRSSIVLALVWFALACTATGSEASTEESVASPTPEPESLVPPTGAWVVIDEGSPRLRVAEVVGIERGRIEVRTIARPIARACAGTLGFEPHYELRFFVQPPFLESHAQQDAQFIFGSGPIDIGDDWGDTWEGLGCTPTKWTASVGSTIHWAKGGEAGVVLVEHELPRDAEERDGRVCFEASEFDVCIESSKLQRSGGECELEAGTGKTVPLVRQAKPEISEGLDRDIVRRIVRAHIHELRSCYTKALRDQPTLAGRVAIAFEIGPTGKVTSSEVHETSPPFPDEAVPKCIAKAVKRWTFPKPSSGATVSVVYPFELSPA